MFNRFRAWINKHRKAVIIVTILAISGVTAILLINGKKVKIPVSKLATKIVPDAPTIIPEAAKTIETVTVEIDGVMKTFPRSEFIRQLHEGWKASSAKIAQAAALGIDLKPGETIVNACTVKMHM